MHLKGQEMLLCHKTFHKCKSMNALGHLFRVGIWICLFFKTLWDHFMNKMWSNYFLNEVPPNNDMQETFSELLYEFEYDCPIIM